MESISKVRRIFVLGFAYFGLGAYFSALFQAGVVFCTLGRLLELHIGTV